MNATINVPRELAAMEKMTPGELRAKYRELFGERAVQGRRDERREPRISGDRCVHAMCIPRARPWRKSESSEVLRSFRRMRCRPVKCYSVRSCDVRGASATRQVALDARTEGSRTLALSR